MRATRLVRSARFGYRRIPKTCGAKHGIRNAPRKETDRDRDIQRERQLKVNVIGSWASNPRHWFCIRTRCGLWCVVAAQTCAILPLSLSPFLCLSPSLSRSSSLSLSLSLYIYIYIYIRGAPESRACQPCRLILIFFVVVAARKYGFAGISSNHTLAGPLWEGYHESRRCSRDTYLDSYITKYDTIRRHCEWAADVGWCLCDRVEVPSGRMCQLVS